MSSTNNLWTDLPMSTGIATLVCYAGVFGDVIGIEEMASRLGATGNPKFYASLDELHRQRRLILREGFAALPNLGDKISLKASKIETTRQLIASRMADIKKLGRNPLIKFVGISGSLAANNPTKDRNGVVDIDVFLVTRKQCIWLYEIPKRLYLNFFPQQEPEPRLCINYVMDESDMRVENRNFYTATEIRNLIPVAGMDLYQSFLRANNWVDYYYPGFSGTSGLTVCPKSSNVINKSLYILVTLLYCLKYFSLEHLRMLTFNTDQNSGTNFNRVCSRRGGYQKLVLERFNRLADIWFADLVNAQLIEKLFPDELSAEISRESAEVLHPNPHLALGVDFRKYEY